MADSDALAEKIEEALWGLTRVYDAPNGGTETGVHAPVHEVVAAVLRYDARVTTQGSRPNEQENHRWTETSIRRTLRPSLRAALSLPDSCWG